MSADVSSLRLLLIQVRNEATCADHELACMMDHFDLDASRVDRANIVRGDVPEWTRVDRADAVIIGGAGDHSVTQRYDYDEKLEELVRRIAGENVPLFGSCYGHQFIARALGGEVITDHARSEVGAAPIELTREGEADPVFGELGANRFDVLVGHVDRVSRLPEGGIELARNATCPYQALRIEGTMVYGTQFHAEMTPERLIERLETHRHYMPDDNEFANLRGSLPPTPITSKILGRFLERVAGGLGG
jgi:GMP synthase (glutamine-hydrolysing)